MGGATNHSNLKSDPEMNVVDFENSATNYNINIYFTAVKHRLRKTGMNKQKSVMILLVSKKAKLVRTKLERVYLAL